MASIRLRRVALGTLAGGILWCIWTRIVDYKILPAKYNFAVAHQFLLPSSRYPHFNIYWYLTLFLVTYILTWVYVSARATLGPGPVTALRVGVLLGFVSAFPLCLVLAAWAPFSRIITLWWLLQLWGGAIVATLVSAWLYKET